MGPGFLGDKLFRDLDTTHNTYTIHEMVISLFTSEFQEISR